MPSVPPAAIVPRNSGSLYLCFLISPIATVPTVTAVATLDPDGAPHTAQATTFECISPPGSHETHWAIAAYMRSAMPVRSMISPIST